MNTAKTMTVPAAANSNADSTRLAWSVRDWRTAVGLGETKTHELIKNGAVSSVKLGGKRLITTPPSVFLASLR